MTRWTFFGRILPECVPLTISLPETTNEYPEFELVYRSKVDIVNAQFVVKATVENNTTNVHSFIDTFRNLVENDIRLATDLAGYLKGCSFDVDIISATSEKGDSVIFGISIPVLANCRKSSDEIEPDLFRVVAENLPARMVLADFREAMRSPVGTGFFCYRAIETMMQSMKSQDEKDEKAWDSLRESMKISRTVLDVIKRQADYSRHGKNKSINDSDRAMIFSLTDEIIRRYISYLRRGRVSLLSSEFPELVCPISS